MVEEDGNSFRKQWVVKAVAVWSTLLVGALLVQNQQAQAQDQDAQTQQHINTPEEISQRIRGGGNAILPGDTLENLAIAFGFTRDQLGYLPGGNFAENGAIAILARAFKIDLATGGERRLPVGLQFTLDNRGVFRVFDAHGNPFSEGVNLGITPTRELIAGASTINRGDASGGGSEPSERLIADTGKKTIEKVAQQTRVNPNEVREWSRLPVVRKTMKNIAPKMLRAIEENHPEQAQRFLEQTQQDLSGTEVFAGLGKKIDQKNSPSSPTTEDPRYARKVGEYTAKFEKPEPSAPEYARKKEADALKVESLKPLPEEIKTASLVLLQAKETSEAPLEKLIKLRVTRRSRHETKEMEFPWSMTVAGAKVLIVKEFGMPAGRRIRLHPGKGDDVIADDVVLGEYFSFRSSPTFSTAQSQSREVEQFQNLAEQIQLYREELTRSLRKIGEELAKVEEQFAVLEHRIKEAMKGGTSGLSEEMRKNLEAARATVSVALGTQDSELQKLIRQNQIENAKFERELSELISRTTDEAILRGLKEMKEELRSKNTFGSMEDEIAEMRSRLGSMEKTLQPKK